LRRRAAISLFAVLVIAVGLAGCSADTSGEPDAAPDPAAAADEHPTGGDQVASDTDDPPAAVEPLGFDTDLFDIPASAGADPAEGEPPFVDAEELIDAGVNAGVWTEVDGVRAVISILVGELSPDALPALDELPHHFHSGVLDRAELLLNDPSVDGAVRADLVRLTSFFFDDSPAGADAETVDDGDEEGAAGAPNVELVSFTAQVGGGGACGSNESLDEAALFDADNTRLCYQRIVSDDGDTVFVPVTPDAIDASDQIFAIIDQARIGYDQLAGSELQEVKILLSPRPSPPDATSSAGDSLAHVASHSATSCRIAVFGTDTFLAGGPHFRFTIAHELFHCIQDTWGGDFGSDELTREGGADFFAYRLLGECPGPQVALGTILDTQTATGSLLDSGYAGWFFWAFLDEHGHLNAEGIAQLHKSVSAGIPVDTGLEAVVGDLPAVMNEFYVRLVGPGLACDFRGSAFTDLFIVDKTGPVELDASLWQGTRYQFIYAQKKMFEQSDRGPGPIGMAKFDERSAEGDWVVHEPEIRSTCDDDEAWMVVVTAPTADTLHTVEVTKTEDGACDPCLIGHWELDLGTVSEFYNSLAAGGPGVSFDISGSWMLEFTSSSSGPATFSDDKDIGIGISDPSGSISVPAVGGGSGPYASDGEAFTITGYTDMTQASFGGVDSPWTTSSGSGGFPYTCENDTLTYQWGDTTIAAARVPETPEGTPYFGQTSG